MTREFRDDLMFEQWLHREFAVTRDDILEHEIYADPVLVDGMPVRPHRALTMPRNDW